ncbi:hypothetical protein HPB52_014793 [Rhipicephalus sanguineus]|uniref:CCHC-type domain-containing protein n=1 Tax=Rhipicephalus sanguineus TaxID=34632 RepID=A0A9D4T640_RHISA|nr:hypothetical protein HPB52_014793 [Rhipicephalus sanguineus]
MCSRFGVQFLWIAASQRLTACSIQLSSRSAIQRDHAQLPDGRAQLSLLRIAEPARRGHAPRASCLEIHVHTAPSDRPIPGGVRGVVHGIEEGTTDEQLEDLLAMNNCKILYARMLGRSTSAVITFEGPHVPFYVKVGCTLSRCRPYRKSVQYCRSCGEIGHRQDVCPNPNDDICNNCGEQNADPNNHKCELKCKLCGMPHETASRECRRKLKPAPPPLRVRERSRSRQRSFGYQNNVVTMNDNDHAPDNVQRKLSWANVVTGHSHSSMESTSTPTTKHYTYEETITILRRENEELRQALELQKKKTQEKEASTGKQLEYLMREIEQLRREQTQNSQTPPSRPPSQPPSSPPQPKPATLANQTKVTQNDLRVLEDRINANMTVVMDDIMSKVSQVVETTVTQLLQTGFQTLKSEMENQIRSLETKMTQSGESFSQRIHTLEERENARKKPNVSRNTSPDLTFVKGLKHYEWSCMDENLGSDHFIVETIIPHHKSTTKIGKAKITDWQPFRKDESAVDATIDDIEMWTRKVVERAEKHTRVIQLSRDTPVVDPHLLHLWEARRGLARRWQRHKWNRKLKVRISKLVEEAQEYSEQLERKNWHNTCNKLQGTLSTKRTWAILKTLLAKKETKSAAKQKVHRLIHNHPGEAQDIIKEVKEKFLAYTYCSIVPEAEVRKGRRQQLNASSET